MQCIAGTVCRRDGGNVLRWNVPARAAAINRVVFACVHNAGRSQMAAAFFNELADPHLARAVSAGTQPVERIHPEVVEVMHEQGLDLSRAKPQLLTAALAAGARHQVTMGCGESCPVIPGAEVIDWPIDDPKGQPLERVRAIRDEIRQRVLDLVRSKRWARVGRG